MIPMPLDYETLRLLWWALLGILLIGFAIMDGFDMGVAFLNPFLGKKDVENRQIINTMAPFWDGNQVWLILGGGAIFAAFPAIYATSFSGFYIAMLLTLLALILRPVSMEFRQKFVTPRARKAFDYTLFASGLIPPLVFGVAFGNLFLGVPFYLDDMHLPHYVDSYFGGFFHLLKPFALLTGIISVLMMATHGAVFLTAKLNGPVHKRALTFAYTGLGLWIVLFTLGGVWVSHLTGFTITSPIVTDGPSNPTIKTVVMESGVWLRNFHNYPILYLVPLTGVLGAVTCAVLLRTQRYAWAFAASGTMVASNVATAGVALFPFLLTSSYNPNHSFTVWDSTSSHLTLWWMTMAAVLFVPLILAYTSWAFHKMRDIIRTEDIEHNKGQGFFY
ncbi:MAG: cytochrome d ubiquinol oxidase subunit II [Pseudomonas fluorescens]|nr:MAG: cytochrome d ubiquinol oxidase subunit II [Pseudomonas fluorescens]